MFRGAAETDLGDISDSCDNGIHAANMGGIWQAVVMGFGGVRQEGGRLTISPHLPPQWRELHFDLSWQGRLLEITVTQTGNAAFPTAARSSESRSAGRTCRFSRSASMCSVLEGRKHEVSRHYF